MPTNLHFIAHAKQVLQPLASDAFKTHTTCLPLHRIALCLPNNRSHFTSAHKTHTRPSPPTITASPHTARRLMAHSLTHYVHQLRQQWHMSQGPRDRYTAIITDVVPGQAAK